ncbi:hypothetical protein [Roseivirga pacifica]|uniref:hypothetical protein n=1 Tax=Roseivirga pacifica TaxID=1267423 RepID=UPI00227A3BA4|nr:hypothetical protein [Roseivirga pacifica]
MRIPSSAPGLTGLVDVAQLVEHHAFNMVNGLGFHFQKFIGSSLKTDANTGRRVLFAPLLLRQVRKVLTKLGQFRIPSDASIDFYSWKMKDLSFGLRPS